MCLGPIFPAQYGEAEVPGYRHIRRGSEMESCTRHMAQGVGASEVEEHQKSIEDLPPGKTF
jgi:hypothetical protein